MHKDAYSLSTDEFVAQRLSAAIDRARQNVEAARLMVAQALRTGDEAGKAGHRLQRWETELARLEADGFTDEYEKVLRHEYEKRVSKAISQGKPVPASLIASNPVFIERAEARRRYERGRRTSFGNRTEAIDDRMQAERGYKVKRQDGKAITPEQIQEIADTVTEVEAVVGSLAPYFRATDLTIAHTSGKRPFLSKAGGLWIPGEGTISIGVSSGGGLPVRAAAHELAHWLDYAAGHAAGMNVRVGRGRKSAFDTTAVSEVDVRPGRDGSDSESTTSAQLFFTAQATMQDTWKAASAMKARGDKRSPEIEHVQVHLGPYWHTPREIWARLFEQYVATKLGRGGLSVEEPEWYQRAPAWWGPSQFATMVPAIEAGIRRRLEMLGILLPDITEVQKSVLRR